MANIYSGMSSAQKDNERKYLNNLVSGGGGNAEWAKSQLKQLDASGSTSSSNKSSGSSNRYNTTVTESNGNKSSGYIENGKSYYDNGQEINKGASVVDSTGKTWVKGGDPDAGLTMDEYLAKYGVSGGSSSNNRYGDMGDELAYNPYEEAYRESQRRYEELEAQIREQNRLAVEQGTNRLNAQKSNINQAADENARQAYVQYMQSQKALPQQLASQGVSGGATETANLGLQTAYQNNVNTINQNKANRLQEIDNAIVELQNTGDLAMVEQVLANNQAALDSYMNTFDKGVGYNQWANQFNANRADVNREYEAQQLQAYWDAINEQEKLLSSEAKEEKDRVWNAYLKGNMDLNYAASLLGYDPQYMYDTKAALEQKTKLDNANTQSLINDRNSGGSGSGGGKTNQTYTQVLNAIQEMNTTSGADYQENLASARYLLNSDLSMPNVISIMKQTNVRPEMFVKQMVDEGLSEQDVVDFIEAYTPKQDYRDALYQYAYN